MPKILCTCSEVLSFSDIPCSIEWRLISDVDLERFSGTVDAEAVYMATEMMLRCPRCDRLWIRWAKGAPFKEYVPAE